MATGTTGPMGASGTSSAGAGAGKASGVPTTKSFVIKSRTTSGIKEETVEAETREQAIMQTTEGVAEGEEIAILNVAELPPEGSGGVGGAGGPTGATGPEGGETDASGPTGTF